MTDSQNPQPVSLAKLRALSASRRKGYENQAIAGFADTVFGCTAEIPVETLDALLDIAEAAQAMFETADRSGENADVWFEGDRMEATEQALKGVRP